MNRKPIAGCSNARPLGAAALALTLAVLWGCEPAFQRIDRRTVELLANTNSDELGPETATPRLDRPPGEKPPRLSSEHLYDYAPPTQNPTSGDLLFTAEDDAAAVVQRLERYAQTPADATRLDLEGALAYAIANSREYRFAEEDYVLSALRLLSERHLWGPRIFDDLSAEFLALGDGGTYDSSLAIINDLRVTQRLPYGGEVSARLLASATQDLHRRVAGENVQTAELIFDGNVPLLRGAGMVAREDLIQAERNVVYAARDFERFRRTFLFDITTGFLNLVAQKQSLVNAQRQVEQLQEFAARDQALAAAGRIPPFDAAITAQSALFAVDGLNRDQESYRFNVDRFKVRLGMPEEQLLVIETSTPGLPTPEIALGDAVQFAMRYRLDLQNRRDFIDDARRAVNNARNALLADLDFFAGITIPTTDDKARAGLDLDFEDLQLRAALALGLPIDRTVERLNLRQAQIDLERSIRDYQEFRDTVAVEVRAAVRDIDRAAFSRQLQQDNVRTAERRLASIEAAPDRATPRDRADTANELLAARDQYLGAVRDLQISNLEYLLDSGQLRVGDDGSIRPLRGMELLPRDPRQTGPGLLPRGDD